MNSKVEAVLKKCSEQIKRDLDPTYSFLHSLYANDVIKREDMETIMANRVSLERVTKLLTILPRRGPSAFTSFSYLLSKENKELREMQQGMARKTGCRVYQNNRRANNPKKAEPRRVVQKKRYVSFKM